MIGQPLTPIEVEHAIDALARLRRIEHEPWDPSRLNRALGRTTRPLRSTLTELIALGVLEVDDQWRWTPTPTGKQIFAARDTGNWEPLARLWIGRSEVEVEALAVLREGEDSPEQVRIPAARARTVAPNVAAVASWVPEWRENQLLVIPKGLLGQAATEAAMDIAKGRPDWVVNREEVGHRAESYSLQLERERRGAAAILHVSRDQGDGYGYDLEDASQRPPRLIECKGSRSRELSFILTANELELAKSKPGQFELHFWGGIDLDRDPLREFELLRKEGYPLVIKDLADALERETLLADCTSWRVGPATDT